MHRHFHRLHGAFANMLAICLALCLPFSGADAQSQTAVVGGPGGTPFKFPCPPGSFLVGLYGVTGQVVDGISGICASWNALHAAAGRPTTGPPMPNGQYFGGQGSHPGRFICPPGSALSGWLIQSSFGNSPRVVGNIAKQTCRSLAPPNDVVASQNHFFGGDQNHSSFGTPFSGSAQ
jgi:hypothetical protein